MAENPHFIEENKADICASLQETIIQVLMIKLIQAAKETGIKIIAVAGGVSANSGLREALLAEAVKRDWEMHIPPFKFTTDNAAMIAITGYYKYLKGVFTGQDTVPFSRVTMK